MKYIRQSVLSSSLVNDSTTGVAFWTGRESAISMQTVATGADTAGTIKLQYSNDSSAVNADGSAATEPTNWSDVTSGSITVAGAAVQAIQKLDICYEWMRAVFTTTVTGIQTVTTVADTAGSLNSKYFLLDSTTVATKYYVWMNVNSAGVDPLVAGRTAVPVALATGATANTVATAVAAAVDALALFISTATTNVATVTNSAGGPFVAAVDVNTGFTIAVTKPVGTVAAVVKTINANVVGATGVSGATQLR